MKKFLLMLFSAVALSAAVHAQDTAAHHHEKGESAIKQQRMDMMQQLNLTDEQKAKMQKLHEEQRVKMDSIRNSSMSDDEKKAQMRTLRENSRKEMDDILTPEQRSKMQEMRKEQMEKHKAQKQGADSTR
jgi:protein CpxP